MTTFTSKIILFIHLLASFIFHGFSSPRPIIFQYHLSCFSQNMAAGTFMNTSFIYTSFQNQFLLKELMEKEIGGVYHFKNNILSIKTNHFGYSKYGEIDIGVGYAKNFAQKVAFGLRFHYLLNHAFEYKPISSFTFDISLQLLISEKIGLGISIYNPAALKYEINKGEMIPIKCILNTHFKMSNNILWFAQIEKQWPGNLNILLGMNYKLSMLYISGHLSITNSGVKCIVYKSNWGFEGKASYFYKTGISLALGIYYLFL